MFNKFGYVTDNFYFLLETVPFYLWRVGYPADTTKNVAAFHVAFPEETEWLDQLNEKYDQSDEILVFCSELHEGTVKQILTLDRPKITLYLCGVINHTFEHARVYRWMDWLQTTMEVYKEKPEILTNGLLPSVNKPYMFDALLGCRRIHRDFVFNYVTENEINALMTYHQTWSPDLRECNQFIVETDGVEFLETPKHTVHRVRYHGRKISISQIVPLTVYNQSHYTIVTETNAVNQFNFYTEKIVKPILAKRLFVVIAGQHYLKNLKAMGFKTFSDVIDEHYDTIDNNTDRYSAAMEQVKYLCSQPVDQVLEKIQDIVDYNYNHLVSNDWHRLLLEHTS